MDLVSIFRLFPDEDACISHLEKVRWNGVPRCPYCKSAKTTAAPKESRHHCNACHTSFSVTVNTIFHHTHLPLQKWFLAVVLMLNAKKGLSARQLARDLEVSKDTAWRISMKIRDAMADGGQRELLSGVVEMDECYIGGKPRKGNKRSDDDGTKNKRGRGTEKVPVVGMVERDGSVRCEVMADKSLNAKNLSALVRANVDTTGTVMMTDQYTGYVGLCQFMEHRTINHQVWYVDGTTHTNTIESFWAILKRGIVGQYHKVSLKYLPMYLNEFSYKYNHRKTEGLFDVTVRRALGVQ